MQIAWTEPALRDLAAARSYIMRDNPSAADRQVERILTAIAGLLQFPEIGRPGRRPGTREMVVPRTAYIAAYRLRGDVVEVLRALHGRRRWPDAV